MKSFTVTKDRIEFTDSRFYATQEGNFVPSVTTILDAYPKDASYFKWLKDVGSDADAIRDEAGRRGSIVHELTEQYDMGEEINLVSEYGSPRYKILEWAMLGRYVEFTQMHKPQVLMMEAHMVSDNLGFAGTLDRVIALKQNNILIDIKTSNSIYPSYWLQLAAYYMLLMDSPGVTKIDEVGILWLNAKTRTVGKNGAIQGIGWQLITKPIAEVQKDWEMFQATHKLWLSINEDMKPKNISYQLIHKK
jgi:hypothetical protein